jgi:hypothetical protein
MLKMLKSWINLKVIFGGIIFALCVFGVLLGILWFSKNENYTPVPATAILKIIEAPTPTPLAPTSAPTIESTPASAEQTPAPAGNLSVGEYVQISGTGGDGLRLHESASVSSTVRYIALEAEVFTIQDGPVEADGYIWWLLQDPYTENAAGWGVSNYLAVIQNPQ